MCHENLLKFIMSLRMEQDRGLGDFERGLVWVCAENGAKKEKTPSEQQLNVVLFYNIFDCFPCLG